MVRSIYKIAKKEQGQYFPSMDQTTYRVAGNFYRGLFLRNGDFLRFAGTNFYNWEGLVFLAVN